MPVKNMIMIFSIFLGSQMVKAKTFFEPYAGWNRGTIDYRFRPTVPVIGGQSGRATLEGPGVGGAFGIKIEKMVLGVQADYNLLDYKDETQNMTAKVKQTNIAGMFGVEFQDKYRGFLSLGSTTAEIDGSVKAKDSGAVAKLGIQYRHHKWAAVSVEYVTYTMHESTSNGVTTKYEDTYDRFYSNAVQFNLRIPLEF